jgi:hypothetical protein
MITVLDKKYQSCSNIFVDTAEGDEYIFESPYSLNIKIDSETEKANIEIVNPDFFRSILCLTTYYSFFIYLLSLEYKIDSIYIENIEKQEVQQTSNGSKGIYVFAPSAIIINYGITEVFDDYKKFRKKN